MCVCLLGCLPHSSASTYDKMTPLDLECKTVVFVEGVPSRTASSNVEISASRSTQEATGAAGNTTIDAGANGCVGGKELRPICYTGLFANVMGIDRHELNNLSICTLAGVADLAEGPVLCCLTIMLTMLMAAPSILRFN